MAEYKNNPHNIYGLNQPYLTNSPIPISLPRDPNISDQAPLGTFWTNTATVDAFIAGAKTSGGTVWVNLSGGPGTGNFDELTVTNNVTLVAGSLDILLGDLLLTQGDISVPAGAINGLAAELTLDSLIEGPGAFLANGTITWDSYGEGVLIADSSGEIQDETGTDGQLIIGGGTTPQFASPTSPGGSIVFTPGAASLGIDVDPSLLDQVTQFDADTGSATPNVSDEIEIVGNVDHFATSSTGDNVVTISPAVDVTLVGSLTTGAAIDADLDITAVAGDIIATAGNLQGAFLNISATSDPTAGGNLQRPGPLPYMWAPGNGNMFIGINAGPATVFGSFTGTDNIGISSRTALSALPALTSGSRNIALNSGNDVTTGSDNILVHLRGNDITTGSRNIVISFSSGGTFVTTGDDNIVLNGVSVTSAAVGTSDCIAIGAIMNVLQDNSIFIDGNNANANSIHIGTEPSTTRFFLAGVYGVTTASATTDPVLISDGFQLGTISSSRRFKQNIEDLDESLAERMMNLRPVTFNYKIDQTKHRLPGLIAEEVDEILPELVNYDKDGIPFSVRYHEMPVLLLAQLQNLNRQVAAL